MYYHVKNIADILKREDYKTQPSPSESVLCHVLVIIHIDHRVITTCAEVELELCESLLYRFCAALHQHNCLHYLDLGAYVRVISDI